MKRILNLCLLLFAVAGLSCTADHLRQKDFYYGGLPWTEPDRWYTGFSGYPWAEDESGWIFSELVLPVPQVKLPDAVKLLSQASYVEIDIEQAKFLLDQRNIDPNPLILSIIFEEEREAARLEKEYVSTLSAENSAQMQNWADEHRRTAEKARGLVGKLEPYLIRAIVLNEPAGAFTAYMKGEELWINHFQMSRRPGLMKKWPIVIFLEKKPAKVYTNISVAE